jgi:hypothetical protein
MSLENPLLKNLGTVREKRKKNKICDFFIGFFGTIVTFSIFARIFFRYIADSSYIFSFPLYILIFYIFVAILFVQRRRKIISFGLIAGFIVSVIAWLTLFFLMVDSLLSTFT